MHRLAGVALAALAAVAGACGEGNGPRPTESTGSSHGVVISGSGTLDGSPFDSRFVGAVVLRDGLVTPCQASLPSVVRGRYSITVLGNSESSGCGQPRATVALWVSADNKILYSSDTVPWPRRGRSTNFAPAYSTSSPNGAVPPLAEFQGALLRRDGQPLPHGTRVEAFVGRTRCGVASLRSTSDFTGYILAVVGPESKPACTRGAVLTFRINGRPTLPTRVVNTPPGQRESLNLTLP